MALGDKNREIWQRTGVDGKIRKEFVDINPSAMITCPTKAEEYRWMVIRAFLDRVNEPPKRNKGEAYRTVSQSRLDRAWCDVAERMDRCESTVREGTLRIYSIDDEKEQTAQFLDDLLELETRLND